MCSHQDWNLWTAIDRQPLIVNSQTLLVDIVNLMNQLRINELSHAKSDGRSKCVLIMEGENLLGILTERDIVKLAAKNCEFEKTYISEVMIYPVITLDLKSFDNIFAPLFLLRRYQIRNLVIISDEKIIGIVTPETIRQVLKPTDLLKLRRVSEVMTKYLIHSPPDSSVFSLTQLMAEHHVSCVVIVEQDNLDKDLSVFKPVGIVTERDIIRFKCLNLDFHNVLASSVMSTPLFLLNPEDSLWTAHQEMQKRKVRRLVVSWDWGVQLGIVTQSSLLKVFDPIEMFNIDETIEQTNQTKEKQLIRQEIDRTQVDLLFNNIHQSLEFLLTQEPLDLRHNVEYIKIIMQRLRELQKIINK